MQGKSERWMRLAELASKEQDAHRLLRIVALINRLLEQKEARLNNRMSAGPPKSQAT
jgi:hypothetical protein